MTTVRPFSTLALLPTPAAWITSSVTAEGARCEAMPVRLRVRVAAHGRTAGYHSKRDAGTDASRDGHPAPGPAAGDQPRARLA